MTNNNIQMSANAAAIENQAQMSEGRGLPLKLIGLGIAFVASIPVLLELLGVRLPVSIPAEVALVILGIGAIISYLLVGLKDCVAPAWRFMMSGGRFPIWPINFIVWFFTFALGGFALIGLPVLICGIAVLKQKMA